MMKYTNEDKKVVVTEWKRLARNNRDLKER